MTWSTYRDSKGPAHGCKAYYDAHANGGSVSFDMFRARLAAAEEAHAAMRDECSALRFDLRAALGERDEARREATKLREAVEHVRSFCADVLGDTDQHDYVRGEQRTARSVLNKLRYADAAQATGREGT